MINFKMTFRFLKKNKPVFFINSLGLLLGIVSCLMISNYATFELSFDKFQKESSSIYRVVSDKYTNGVLEIKNAYTDVPLGPFLKENIVGIKDYFRLHFMAVDFSMQVGHNEAMKLFNENNAYFADQSIAKYLGFTFIRGDVNTALSQPNKVIISESIANKYFGQDWRNKSIIGEAFLFKGDNNSHLFQIEGVFNDYPPNSHLEFDFLFSHNSLSSFFGKGEIPAKMVADMLENMWGRPQWYTYVVLEDRSDYKLVQEEVNRVFKERAKRDKANKPDVEETYELQPISSIHLYSNLSNEPTINGDIKVVYFLFIIAFFIVAFTWTNLANLSIGLYLDRLKEFGIKKVVGASRRSLTIQFLQESLIQNLLVFGLTIALYATFLPIVSDHLSIRMVENWWSYDTFWIELLILFVLSICATAMYPILVLSSLNPSKALKGKLGVHISRAGLKDLLIGIQFTISIVLITFTLVIYKQILFLQKKDIGVSIENKLVISAPKSIMDAGDFKRALQVFKNSVLSVKENVDVSASTFIPGHSKLWDKKMVRISQDANESKMIKEIGVDRNYITDMKFNFLAGGNFAENPSKNKSQVILNRQALKVLGFERIEDAYPGKVGVLFGAGKIGECEIVGVIEDFHQRAPKNPYDPVAFFCNVRTGFFVLTFANEEIPLKAIKENWQRTFPDTPFEFFFLEDHYERQYADDKQFANVAGIFTFLALIIAAMGVFGLTNYMAVRRIKEITLRKIVGASIGDILMLFVLYFLKFMVLAMLIGIPMAILIGNRWLDNYAFRREISLDIIAMPILVMLFMVAVSSSYGSLKIAIQNPVKSLKRE
ncbi:ABC transporter permease [Fulvivirgaceae bacterium BMA12]|uniref:ABC transporter permease n=1 Tax=Agaribacillus aureus TaxID=3051825 RepID=A0ABT8LGW0_9BACT|nr:ABC transporter permease [Fulvivirgaceae bacterium BMA12]